MTIKKPLVVTDGQVEQIQSDDFIDTALVKNTQATITIPSGYQYIAADEFEITSLITINDGGLLAVL